MKSTPTNSSVDAYCFVQRVPSAVAKIAWAPTAQPRRGPTICIAASAGTNPGSTAEGVADGSGVGESLAEGVGDGDALGEGEALAVAVGAGLSVDAEVHPARTTATAMTPQAWTIRRDWVPPPM